MSYEISFKAKDDIEKIWSYTAKTWSRAQANRYSSLIFNEIRYLAENTETGQSFKSIRKDYRYSKVKSHLIFFRYFEHQYEIEIIRVLHQQMDIENRLEE